MCMVSRGINRARKTSPGGRSLEILKTEDLEQMEFDNSWAALLKPGRGNRYFDLANSQGFETKISEYSPINAWWLAEISRLVYKDDRAGDSYGRSQYFHQANLTELKFLSIGPTQCVILESTNDFRNKVYIVAFRGTSQVRDWLTNLNIGLVSWSAGGRVHKGFKNAFEGVSKQINEFLTTVERPVFFTGHSLGGALAILAASRFAEKAAAVYTFGSPRVGDQQFAASLTGFGSFRIVNGRDIVARIPDQRLLGYRDAGNLCFISPDQRILTNPTPEVSENGQRIRENYMRDDVYRRRWLDPPSFLADHAPINYVAHLQRQIIP